MCSTVIIGADSHKFLAENYDHRMDHGLIGVNLKGTIKENGRQAGEKILRWQVQYGSITFNQFSLELPASGMNEKGLCVALMWHYGGDFGTADKYSRLSALQWIQYQLDNYQNIAEVLQGLETMRPKQEGVPLHYSFLDADGNTLQLEFIGGEPKGYLNQNYPILTNSSYAESLEAAEIETNEAKTYPNQSIARFIHLYRQTTDSEAADLTPLSGFDLLKSVSQTPDGAETFPWNTAGGEPTVTAWSIVFNPAEKSILLKTHKNNAIRELRLADFNFEKEADYLIMDINAGTAGNIRSFFKSYSREENQNIVRRTAQVFQMPEPAQNALVNMVDVLYRNREMRIG
ncbi:MAG: linear amide C-N hydrolase [Candidatus Marinimicrobia bacterium]|nr:linear amide C-N hydrolase [Candidatus Neomarinimicrobiota bacterium]